MVRALQIFKSGLPDLVSRKFKDGIPLDEFANMVVAIESEIFWGAWHRSHFSPTCLDLTGEFRSCSLQRREARLAKRRPGRGR